MLIIYSKTLLLSNIVTAYQTLEHRDNIDEIEMDGPFECQRNDAWLGIGYYFWDTNVEWAHSWGRTAYERIGKKYLIGSCEIDIGNQCFDLVGSVGDREVFIAAVKAMEELVKEKGQIIVPNVLQYLKLFTGFPYKSIRSQDIPRDTKKLKYNELRKEHTLLNQRVQICVIDKKGVLLSPFLVIHPQKKP